MKRYLICAFMILLLAVHIRQILARIVPYRTYRIDPIFQKLNFYLPMGIPTGMFRFDVDRSNDHVIELQERLIVRQISLADNHPWNPQPYSLANKLDPKQFCGPGILNVQTVVNSTDINPPEVYRKTGIAYGATKQFVMRWTSC